LILPRLPAGFSGAELRATAAKDLQMPPPPRRIVTAIATCLKDATPTFGGRYEDIVSTYGRKVDRVVIAL